jgi:diguanylate cyclase (GGDEF)-like protein
VVGYRAIRQDITDKKEVELMAITDRLTQIYNRIHLDIVLNKEIEESKKYGLPFSIILLDIDKFKSVNDTYGHNVGDKVLVQVGHTLLKTLRNVDIVARWGGEEFVVLLPTANIENAKKIADDLRANVESLEIDVVGGVTISLGVALVEEGSDMESVIEKADQALYLAKESGRNCVKIYN